MKFIIIEVILECSHREKQIELIFDKVLKVLLKCWNWKRTLYLVRTRALSEKRSTEFCEDDDPDGSRK